MTRTAGNKKQPNINRQRSVSNPKTKPAVETEPSINERALDLLQDPDFFGKVREAAERGGLVGEARNSLALYVIGMSSLGERPLNAIVKGSSSGGKNFLVSRVLRLFPETAIREITGASRLAWNYSKDDFRNRIIYLQERNDRTGALDSLRQLASENLLRRTITVRKNGQLTTETFEARGPVSIISTTTRDRIQIDDETRNVSLWVDESTDQNRRILQRQVSPLTPLSEGEIAAWHEAYELIAKRASIRIKFPDWFGDIAKNVYADDIRVRRYFPSFLEAVRTIALLRSYRTHPEDYKSGESIPVRFRDYAIAACVFEEIFSESLNRGDDDSIETFKAVEAIASNQKGKPVDARELARYLRVSYDKASSKLRAADEAGLISRANEPEKNNSKRFLPNKFSRFIPDPGEVIKTIPGLTKPVEFAHPVTGKMLKFAGK